MESGLANGDGETKSARTELWEINLGTTERKGHERYVRDTEFEIIDYVALGLGMSCPTTFQSCVLLALYHHPPGRWITRPMTRIRTVSLATRNKDNAVNRIQIMM